VGPKIPKKEAVAELRKLYQERRIKVSPLSPERLRMYEELSLSYNKPVMHPVIWMNVVVVIVSACVAVILGVLK